MSRERYELVSIIDRMVELMGTDEVLIELASAMSVYELEANLEFIDRMNDLGLMSDEEDEDYV